MEEVEEGLASFALARGLYVEIVVEVVSGAEDITTELAGRDGLTDEEERTILVGATPAIKSTEVSKGQLVPRCVGNTCW